MIKITGGRDKGRLIKSPKGLSVRPILATIRKVLFDTLSDRIVFSKVLDVFAGVGTVGIEALSRGAEHVVFIEKDFRVAKILKENLELLGYTQSATVIVGDALKILGKVKDLSPFDVIYLGPPYDFRKIRQLPLLYASLLSEDGVMVLQHHHKTLFDLPEGFEVKIKRIGENQLTFFRRKA